MLIFKKYIKHNFFFKITIVIIHISTLFFITSCSLKQFTETNDNFLFDYNKNQFKKLIIPKGMHIPPQNKDYYLPYTQKDLENKNYDIFPPV